ncbi:MAG: hypothetical protein ACM3SM_00425 [Bacteroidota bacterium]
MIGKYKYALLVFAACAVAVNLYIPVLWDNAGFRDQNMQQGKKMLADALPKRQLDWIWGTEEKSIHLATEYSLFKVYDGQAKPFEDKYVKQYRDRVDSSGGIERKFREYYVVRPIIVTCYRSVNTGLLLLNDLLALMIAALTYLIPLYIRNKRQAATQEKIENE